MVVRLYEDAYHDDIITLVDSFYEETLSNFGVKLDPKALEETIEDLKGTALMLLADKKCVGILAGKEAAVPFSSERVWHEVIWYVAPEYRREGIKFLRRAKEILKEAGYDLMVMVGMENKKISVLTRVYNILGFQPLERHYIGRL